MGPHLPPSVRFEGHGVVAEITFRYFPMFVGSNPGTRGLGWADDAVPTLKGGSTLGIPSPPAIVLPNKSIVTPHLRDAERMQGFDAGWTEASETVTRRGHRWKLVGNAVTVDAAEWLGQRLRAPDPTGRNVSSVPLARPGAWPRAAFNVGEGRRTAVVSAWPERRARAHLYDFLQHEPALLSVKAKAIATPLVETLVSQSLSRNRPIPFAKLS